MTGDQVQPWVDGLTIGQVLSETAQREPDREAAVFAKRDLRLSWSDLDSLVDRTARALLAIGIQPGQHVAVWATNVPEWVVLQFATAKIGVVLVTINPAYRPFELQYVLNQSDAVALFLVDRFKASDYFSMLNELCPDLAGSRPGELELDEFPKLKNIIALCGDAPRGTISFDSFLARHSEIVPQRVCEICQSVSPSSAINIQYTSGTTGFPKAATLSHRNLLLNAYYVGQCQRFTIDDRICIPVPFYHCFGCVLGTLCAAVYGATMIIPAEYFNATDTLDAIEHYGATAIYGVPTMFIAELEDPSFERRDLSSLRTGIMAGSPCPIEVMKKVIDEMGAHQMTIAYGQTEASPVVTQTRVDDPIKLRVETVGRSIPGVETKIVDPATGEELGDDQQGEFCSRGHVVMLGYYKDEQATSAAIDNDGWLHSGDLAVRLSNGYYKITGRIKDMVIRGGENIYPREIEEYLFTHPAVEQSAVVGVPDPKFGEELCAWIKLKSDETVAESEILDYCRGNLAHYKVPRYIRFVESFPQTVTGKIQKFKIRESMMNELGLTEQETA